MTLFKTAKHILACSIFSLLANGIVHAQTEMIALSDQEMSAAEGQALLTLGYTAPSGATNSPTNFGFYKLGLEAQVELNANIRALQLGCGGINGPGACDIEMQNVQLSGINDGNLADGTPYWTNGRAASSAKLTNPFIEFAIRNPTSAATREVVGFRLSAEQISGYLSAGLDNIANPTDGIKTFSGYLIVGDQSGTPVTTKTAATKFGTTYDQMIYGRIGVLSSGLLARTIYSNVKGMQTGTWGITVPSLNVNFNFPQTYVTGNRMQQLDLQVRGVPIGDVAISGNDGGISLSLNEDINVLIASVSRSTFYMGTEGVSGSSAIMRNGRLECPTVTDCSYLRGINADVRVLQNFNLVHNLPITSGGYLSLQNTAVKWPGSNSDIVGTTQNEADIAQAGWWMSFKDPLNFGALNTPSNVAIDMAPVLPQVTTYITNFMKDNVVTLNINDAVNAIVGLPIYKSIGDINVSRDPASMTLENLLLDNYQKVIPNCWGNLKFC